MENFSSLPIQASQILVDFKSSGLLESMQGPDTLIQRIDNVENATADSLVFVSDAEFVQAALAAMPAAIVTTKKLTEEFTSLSQSAVFICTNVKLAHAKLRSAYADRDLGQHEWEQIHPSAVIHESAELANDVIIAPNAVIGRNVQIGTGSIIMANSVIEEGVRIGADTVIHPGVVIGYNNEIGNRVIIKAGCTIGMEGFGFAADKSGKNHRIPQLGKVVIEDDVVFGSSCNVDRATYTETRIGAGCKFDALCHIAHNVVIDEDCLIVAQSGVAGTVQIGKRVILSGQTAISDHVVIGDDVILLHRAGVISDIKTPGAYAGIPTQPLRKYFKNVTVAHQLIELRKQVQKLEKKLTSLKEAEK
ncbi:UDP-3-O-[3-hydroxymyristoyl] glucosamine N-acyltransferase [hydrothermal vent metagenome]|uniref:UDP-3-O-[3-hydroxymyristoyl] glucosamine N-acyltransferase n=1 Tax=hydrothermal vent metagenome TaxID=652676 RepID=A0A3B1AIF4_9ZZZZ